MRAIKIVSKNLGDKENDRVLTELKALEKLVRNNNLFLRIIRILLK